MYVGLALLGPAEFFGGAAYSAHVQQLIDEETERAGIAYLTAASYPPSASALAWEALDGKNGKIQLDHSPSARAALAWRYLAQPDREAGGVARRAQD